jgi:hypothetical protein
MRAHARTHTRVQLIRKLMCFTRWGRFGRRRQRRLEGSRPNLPSRRSLCPLITAANLANHASVLSRPVKATYGLVNHNHDLCGTDGTYAKPRSGSSTGRIPAKHAVGARDG